MGLVNVNVNRDTIETNRSEYILMLMMSCIVKLNNDSSESNAETSTTYNHRAFGMKMIANSRIAVFSIFPMIDRCF